MDKARFVPAPLHERSFRLLFTAQAGSAVGSSMFPLALSFAVLSIQRSATSLGLVLMAFEIPLVAFLLVGGVVADRLQRRTVMIGADLTRACTQAAMAALLLTGSASVWELALLNMANGAASAFFFPASVGLVPETVTAANLQQANALRGLADSGATVIGPVIAGVLVAAVGPAAAILVDSASFVWSAAVLTRIASRTAETLERPTLISEIRSGWKEFRQRTWLWLVVLHSALFHLFCLAPFLVLGVLVADRSLDGAAGWSAILGANAAGAVAGGLVILKRRVARPLAVGLAAMALYGAPLAALALGTPTAVVAVAAAAAGVGLGVFGGLWDTTLQREVPADVLSRVASYDWLGSLASLPIGLAVAGPVAAAIGTSTVFAIGAVYAVGSILALLLLPNIRAVASPLLPHVVEEEQFV